MPDELAQQTVSLLPDRDGERPLRASLLVLEGDGSAIFDLPARGEVIIGRGESAGLRLEEPAASRQHAKLTVGGGSVVLQDLGSHNGTRLNGEWLRGPRQLSTGDVIGICDCTLVLHAAGAATGLRPICDEPLLQRRLLEEVERAADGGRPLSVVSISLGAAVSRDQVARAASSRLRLADVLGWGRPDELLVLVIDAGLDTGLAEAQLLLEALGALAPQARAGVAALPDDGCAAGTLLSAARAAASSAEPTAALAANRATTRLALGDREVLLADPAMQRLYQLIKRLAASDLPILICGETGTGKENAAFAVHHHSARRAGPFVAVNCAAIAEPLLESELFGHERGAFTGAAATKLGLFETADHGTVFLDEVGELSPAAQAKLLRALETRRLQRVGGVEEREVDLRVVAATHKDLKLEAEQGRFRQDLYFRLAAATVVLPPLRDRPREIAVLARAFLAAACARLKRPPMAIGPAAMRALFLHAWPGNVRELKNALEFVAAAVPDAEVAPWHLPGGIGGPPREETGAAPSENESITSAPRSFRPIAEEIAELERQRMVEALEAAGGNRTRAAASIQMPLRTFVSKMKQYSLGKRS